MTNITYDILDESFFTKSQYEYHLHLLLADDASTYLIHDEDQLLAYRSYQLEDQNRELFSWKDELQALMHQDKMLQLSFKTVKISLLHQAFTFVPTELYESHNEASYLQKVSANTSNEMICHDDLKYLSIKNIYALKFDLQRFIKETFPNVEIFHSISHLVNNLSPLVVNENLKKKLFMNFHQKQVQIILFEGKNLLFANNFQFQTGNDVAYFLMLVVNQFKLNPEIIEVILSGQIEKDTEVYNTIFRYVRNLSFLDYAIAKDKKRAFTNIENHLFLNIL
jgi:hypothetical protein